VALLVLAERGHDEPPAVEREVVEGGEARVVRDGRAEAGDRAADL